MKKDEVPVDVVQLADVEAAQVPLAAELADFLRRARLMFEAYWARTLQLAERLGSSGLDTKDDELAYHHLWLKQARGLFEEMAERARQLEDQNELRIALVVMSRGSDGFLAFGKKFRAAGDVIPTPPAQKSEEWPAYIAYMRAHHADRLADTVPTVPFGALRALAEEYAARGQELPYVKLASKLSVKVTG